MYKNKIDYFRIKDWIKKAEYNIYIYIYIYGIRITSAYHIVWIYNQIISNKGGPY